MGSIGQSAERRDNTLATWYDARRKLDAMFIQCREENLEAVLLPEDELAPERAVFIRHLNAQWKRATIALRNALLPQRKAKGKYRATHTVNPKVGNRKKTLPAHSIVARKMRGVSQHKRERGPESKRHKSKRSRYRSHHPFNPRTGQGYRKIQEGRGRPKVDPVVSRIKARMRDRKKEIRRKIKCNFDRESKGLKPYRKLTPAVKATRKKAKEERLKSLAKARAEWSAIERRKWAGRPENFKRLHTLLFRFRRFNDERPNHHPEHLYRTPRVRQRAKEGSRRHYHRLKEKQGMARKLIVRGAVMVRAFHANHLRSVHMHGYWREVRRLRGNGRAIP